MTLFTAEGVLRAWVLITRTAPHAYTFTKAP
jgi:hypothetical protein